MIFKAVFTLENPEHVILFGAQLEVATAMLSPGRSADWGAGLTWRQRCGLGLGFMPPT